MDLPGSDKHLADDEYLALAVRGGYSTSPPSSPSSPQFFFPNVSTLAVVIAAATAVAPIAPVSTLLMSPITIVILAIPPSPPPSQFICRRSSCRLLSVLQSSQICCMTGLPHRLCGHGPSPADTRSVCSMLQFRRQTGRRYPLAYRRGQDAVFPPEVRPPLTSTISNRCMACISAPPNRLFWGCWGLISYACGILKIEHLILLSFCTYGDH